MDEIGLMVVGIESNGLLQVKTVGGVDERVLVSKPVVVGENHVPGVIGAKAIHLQKPHERKKPLEVEQLYIDIGVKNNEEAEKMVKIGDYAALATTHETGDNRLIGKAAGQLRDGAIL